MSLYPFIFFCLVFLQNPSLQKAPWPDADWPVADPGEQGMNGQKLAALDEILREGKQFPDLHSLLVVRHGFLVHESYYKGYDKDDPHTLQSVSKSITSALIGIAIDKGIIKDVDEKVLGFFPKMTGIQNNDARKAAMRLEDLLTMRSGNDYREDFAGSPHDQLNRMSSGWTRFILDRKMVRQPGTFFQYDSGGVILMSAMIEARTGSHADVFAQKHLFGPLGITRVSWYKNSEGHPHMGGGLDLRPRDMARFGLLYLRGGRWRDRAVVSERWVAASLSRHVTFSKPRWDKTVGYGYLWWLLPPSPKDPEGRNIYAAMGFRGQYIFLVHAHDLVVVNTAGARGRAQGNPIEFLYSHILPAVER